MAETKQLEKQHARDAVIDTGAALASASAFALVGGVIGRSIGSYGDSVRHKISSTLGTWIGAGTFGILSLYASFRSHQQREHEIAELQRENVILRQALDELLPPEKSLTVQGVHAVTHEGVVQAEGKENAPVKK